MFRSPDRPDTVTFVYNVWPLQKPEGGPNFYRFGDDVAYRIVIDDNGDSADDTWFEFRFRTEIRNPNTFLYNTGPVSSLNDPNLNVRQFYTVTRVRSNGEETILVQDARSRRRTSDPSPPRTTRPSPSPRSVGDLDGALRAYEGAQRRVRDHVPGIAGVARVRAARGDLAGAARLYERALERAPMTDIQVALGDVYRRLGDTARAEALYAQVTEASRFHTDRGVNDVEQALFDAERGRALPQALAVSRAEHAQRPSIHVADALAWAEFRSGDIAAARRYSEEALRLGTRDPGMLYRAGVIAEAAGDRERALALLQRSSALNPRFSVLFADDLATRLQRLSAQQR